MGPRGWAVRVRVGGGVGCWRQGQGLCQDTCAISLTRVWMSWRHSGQVSNCKAHSMHIPLGREKGERETLNTKHTRMFALHVNISVKKLQQIIFFVKFKLNISLFYYCIFFIKVNPIKYIICLWRKLYQIYHQIPNASDVVETLFSCSNRFKSLGGATCF